MPVETGVTTNKKLLAWVEEMAALTKPVVQLAGDLV